MDLVISNCVVNLSPDKPAVLQSVWNALKPGGEFYFSDIYCDRRLPERVKNDELLYGECLGGALYVEDFVRICRSVGFADPRVLSTTPVPTATKFQVRSNTLFEFELLVFRCAVKHMSPHPTCAFVIVWVGSVGQCQLHFDHVPSVQTARPHRNALRRLRPNRCVPRHNPRPPPLLRAGRPPPVHHQ
jgi:hypothetical protein